MAKAFLLTESMKDTRVAEVVDDALSRPNESDRIDTLHRVANYQREVGENSRRLSKPLEVIVLGAALGGIIAERLGHSGVSKALLGIAGVATVVELGASATEAYNLRAANDMLSMAEQLKKQSA